jgi:hypothetical protein
VISSGNWEAGTRVSRWAKALTFTGNMMPDGSRRVPGSGESAGMV